MTTVNRILVCSELGRASDNALRRAALLCRATGAHAEVLHVIDHPVEDTVGGFGLDNSGWHDNLRLAAMAALEKQVERCWPEGLTRPGLALRDGPIVPAICQHLAENAFDLVVTGARGGGMWKKYFIGTTATRVVRKLKLPVLVVKRAAEVGYKRILVPVDFSDYSAWTLEATSALTPGARVTLMHAYEAPYEGKMAYGAVDEDAIMHYLRQAKEDTGRRLRAMALDAGLKQGRFSLLLRHGHAYREVREAERTGSFDCVAIGKHGRGFLNELLLGSTTEHMLLESSADVLVIPLPE